jgi:sensor histidine kinase YesM
MAKKPRGTTTQSINFWAMMNNVIIASLAKGQLLPVLFFFAFILMILKMESPDVSRLMFAILADLETGRLLGYVLAPVVTAAWYLHARWQRRGFEIEMRRMAEKRDEIQEQVLPNLLESSQPERKKNKQ